MVKKGKEEKKHVSFIVKGSALLEEMDKLPEDINLRVYAFSRSGQLLGESVINKKGDFTLKYKIAGIAEAKEAQLIIAPKGDEQSVRKSSGYRKLISATDWEKEEGVYQFRPKLSIPTIIWHPWLPKWICVSGHVRKLLEDDGISEICPVPFLKVEIYDVDREFCWWPYFRRWWDKLADKRIFRIPELLKERVKETKPFPVPDPVPLIPTISEIEPGSRSDLDRVAINPQPEPPGINAAEDSFTNLGPQPEPPDFKSSIEMLGKTGFERVGESRMIDPGLAARFDKLTLTTKIAPWFIFPRCFYSKAKICEATTDEHGYFNCCFQWWPFHFRRGRLRFDSRPDIIIKVTQIIEGVEQVIYLDPYTSTRWNVTNAHIDLWLDDEEIVCGSGDDQVRPHGVQTFLTRIGDDEIYKIDQTTGLSSIGSYSNVAYGGLLRVYGQFGDSLSDGGMIPGKYYRLSYAKLGSPATAFKPITVGLYDTRVNKATDWSETHKLGPLTVNGIPGLYEIRDALHYFWYNPDILGYWKSWQTEVDTNKYILRLEVFDANGNKVGSPAVDYLDGTSPPNGVLPSMTDQADLVITLDNKPPVLELDTPAVNDCGVIPWSSVPPMNLQVKVSQENNRLHQWRLQYTKGVISTVHIMARNTSNSGTLSPVSETVDATNYLNPYGGTPAYLNILDGVTTTCAFALKLWAKPHIRDGRHFVYYREIIKAIAIEKCDE